MALQNNNVPNNNGVSATPENSPGKYPAVLLSAWPGAFKAYKPSQNVVMNVLGVVLLLIVISLVFNIIPSIFYQGESPWIIEVILFVLNSYVSVAFVLAYLQGVRGRTLSLNGSLSQALPYLGRMILLQILATVIVVGSLLLLIVPFFFVFPRLVLADYFLIDKNQGVIESLKSSWAATKGHVGKVYGIIGAAILMALLMITIIGIPIAIYLLLMYSAVFVVLYEYIIGRKTTSDQK